MAEKETILESAGDVEVHGDPDDNSYKHIDKIHAHIKAAGHTIHHDDDGPATKNAAVTAHYEMGEDRHSSSPSGFTIHKGAQHDKKLMSMVKSFHKTFSEETIEEETASAATLKPGAGSGGGDTKAEMLATFTSMLAQLGKEDLSKFFNDAQAIFGPNKAPGAEDKSASNRATVDAKPSAAVGKGAWKEDVDEMFGGEELSEDFREKATTVFEAAVNTRINIETARLEEEYEARAAELEEQYEADLQEKANEMFEELSGKLDQYLDYCVEQWMEDNKIAVETSLRADVAESFIGDLHNLFTQHYITVPESKVDIVAEMKAELEEVKNKLNETLDEKIALQTVIDEATKEAAFDEISEGLAETQVEKLRTLAEGIEYTDADTFRKKLNIVKESYFTGKKASTSTGLITEEIDGDDNTDASTGFTAPGMDKYVQAIAKSVK